MLRQGKPDHAVPSPATEANVDGDLLLLAKNGDEQAFSMLAEKYQPLITAATAKFRRLFDGDVLGSDDVRQEALLAFYRAVMSYDGGKSTVSFGLYAKICVNNRIISLLRKARTEKKRAAAAAQMKESAHTTDRYFPSLDGVSEMMDRLLTKYEKKVFSMYLEGKSYKDIALTLGRNEKSVDNALFRAKAKLRSGYHM